VYVLATSYISVLYNDLVSSNIFEKEINRMVYFDD
jgi:hypothetical protein